MRRLAILVALASASSLAGCKADTFCLNCGLQDGSPYDLTPPDDLSVPPDLVVFDFTVPPDMTVLGPDGGPCMITNAGVEICDHLDNDCNGKIDDVAPSKLQSDPENCGACFHTCDYTAIHEVGVCTNATCMPGACLPGWVDLDKNPANGCEYNCTPSVPPTEVCDGKDNDCNGITDDPFGYPKYNIDPKNCGACANVCNLPGAVSTCASDPTTGNGVCAVDHCINDGKNTYRHQSSGTGLNTTGCEYHCPFPSTTVTTGSQDCDTAGVTCAFPPETCNGIDDDCDRIVDDNLTDVGPTFTCGSACPGGKVANCVGQCKAGALACVSGVKVCQGSVGPTPELCNGKDDDCDGVTDDNLQDSWIAQPCCPTGNTSDCVNTGGGTRCSTGMYQCQAGMKACSGGVSKVPETCNAIDDDCNGLTDDVSGVGTACTGAGINTVGQCTAQYTCNGGVPGPGPSGLTCTQKVGPMPEVCNGKDDNCNGLTDEGNPGGGVACGQNCPGGLVANCIGACVAGVTACTGGALLCNGSTGPVPEVCNGIDDNCNGLTDDNPTDAWIGQTCCSTGNLADCANSGTGTYCKTSKYTCVAGGRACAGSIAKSGEICNSLDDDCNGITDDVSGIGSPCTGGTTNTAGTCTASYKCTGSPGPGPNGLTCTQLVGPKAEVCDGLDNDCDGITDDNLTDVGAAFPCYQKCPGGVAAGCVGQCKAGQLACSSGVKSCSGSVGPTAEVCDGLDNDCNGVTDDGFGFPNYNVDPKNCGKCGTVCALANAVNKCVSDATIDPSGKGVCEVVQCNPGFNYAPLSPKAGDPAGTCTGGAPGPENGPTGVGCYYTCPVYPTSPESCNGKDDNCNGCVDDGLTPPANFCANKGVCATSAGLIKELCAGASGWKCDYSAVPGINIDASGNLLVLEKNCDGLDNNCNGVTDKDGFPTLGSSCSAGIGVCQNFGTIVCTTSTTSGCSVTASSNKAVDELCNGKDDNCDGQTDERTPNAGFTCNNGGTHPCLGYTDPMVHEGAVWVYQYEAGRPDATSVSQGGNSARACANAGVIPWTNVTETQAAAACAAIKNSAGNPMRLCTAPEWTAACEGPGGAAPSKWSYSATPTTYAAKICNDVNEASTPAVWDTGTVTATATAATKFCYTDWAAAGRLYDLSGNVSEWTSTTLTSGGNTYYKLRGGSYSSPQGGTTCEFDFDIAQATFANTDVGFRCCSDAAP
jgi:hypothetical protein